VLNAIVAESLDAMATEIEKRGGAGDRREVIQGLVRELLSQHRRILFSGDNYSQEWVLEAERRGLCNLRDTPSALAAFSDRKNVELFDRYAIFSARETESRANVQVQMYVHRVAVEALTAREIASTQILPAAIQYQKQVGDALAAASAVGKDADLKPQRDLLVQVAESIARLGTAIDQLARAHHAAEELPGGAAARAAAFRDRVLPAMNTVREAADVLEGIVGDELWPLPKYREILFLH